MARTEVIFKVTHTPTPLKVGDRVRYTGEVPFSMCRTGEVVHEVPWSDHVRVRFDDGEDGQSVTFSADCVDLERIEPEPVAVAEPDHMIGSGEELMEHLRCRCDIVPVEEHPPAEEFWIRCQLADGTIAESPAVGDGWEVVDSDRMVAGDATLRSGKVQTTWGEVQPIGADHGPTSADLWYDELARARYFVGASVLEWKRYRRAVSTQPFAIATGSAADTVVEGSQALARARKIAADPHWPTGRVPRRIGGR